MLSMDMVGAQVIIVEHSDQISTSKKSVDSADVWGTIIAEAPNVFFISLDRHPNSQKVIDLEEARDQAEPNAEVKIGGDNKGAGEEKCEVIISRKRKRYHGLTHKKQPSIANLVETTGDDDMSITPSSVVKTFVKSDSVFAIKIPASCLPRELSALVSKDIEQSNGAGLRRATSMEDYGIALIHGHKHLPHLKQGFMSSSVTAS